MGRLSAARERKGLSLRQASERTGIRQDLLAALEAEENVALAPGGIAERCLMEYERFLGIEESERSVSVPAEETQDTTGHVSTDPGHRERVPFLRLLGVGVSLVLIAILGVRVASFALEPRVEPPAPTEQATGTPALDLSIRAIEALNVKVEVDGAPAFTGELKPRQLARYLGRERIGVYVPDLTRVTLNLNGSRVEPLGNLTAGRWLVFIAD